MQLAVKMFNEGMPVKKPHYLGTAIASFLLLLQITPKEALASQCQLQFRDKQWAASQGVHPTRMAGPFTPAGKYYSQDRGGTVYIWMGLHIPSSKVKVVSSPSSCANLKQLLGD